MRLEVAMRAALSLARHGLGVCHPNPSVGCVILDVSNNLIGSGRTSDGGRPHAEFNALSNLDVNPDGGTALVTLEPCAHKGQTPSCAELLVNSGIKKVIISILDPDKRTAGKGIKLLKDAGINVEVGLCKEEAFEINKGYFLRIRNSLPLVTLKIASSMDGKIATKHRESKWITGKIARNHGHLLRANHDAILVGINTIISDNSKLNCRLNGLKKQSPVKVIVDSRLSIPLSANVLKNINRYPVIIWTQKNVRGVKKRKLLDLGVNIKELPKNNKNQLNLKSGLEDLANKGYTRVLVEGGSEISSSLLSKNLVNKIFLYRSGIIIGGDGLSSIASYGLKDLKLAKNFNIVSSKIIDNDLLEEWQR